LILFENLALVSRLVSPCSVWFWSVWVQDWVQEQAAAVVPARILALLDYLRAVQLFQPAIPTRGTKVPAGPDWLYEIKYDGYRLRLERDGDRVRLITRGGYNWTDRYR
jgi:ATP-dependent DNA ligase